MKFFKMVVVVSILTVAVGIGGTLYIYFNQDKFDLPFVDSDKFKKEYESLNNKKIPGTNYTYKYLTVSDNNNFRYSSYEEINDILDSGTGVIYFGYKSCLDCRSIINVLDDTVSNYDSNIYYLDTHKDKNTTDYKKLVNRLKDNLIQYTDKDLTIIYPTVVFVKNGSVIGIKSGTVEEHNKYYSLNAREEEKLKQIFSKYLEDM